MPSDAPVHVINDVNDKTTRCGIRTNRDDHYPVVLARWVQAHIDGHGMTVCPECDS